MQEGDVVLGGLVLTDQNAPVTVQPTVRAFHHPASRFEPSLPFDGLSLFAPTADVGGEAELVQGTAHLGEVVALVQAQPLGMRWAGRWPIHWPAVHRGPHQLHIVAVGPVHCQSNRNALGFRQQAAFDAPLTPIRGVLIRGVLIRGVGAGFFPRPRGTWSWPRPYSANSSPDPSIRHNASVPPATVPGTPQRRPIPESAAGRWTRNICPLRPRLSTGSRYVADAVGAGAVRNPGTTAAKTMGVHPFGDQGLQHVPQLVGDLESAGGGIGFGGWPSTLRTRRLGVFRFGHCPSLVVTSTGLTTMDLHVSISY